MKSIITALSILICAFSVSAKEGDFSYDVRGGSGSYHGGSYTEINLGLNWNMKDWLTWRNALFTEFGSELKTVYGLDSSLLFQYEAFTQGRGLGVEMNAGPGLRFGTENSNAIFGTAGITFIFGGLALGGGVQALHYLADRMDRENRDLPPDEVRYYITISGGGRL